MADVEALKKLRDELRTLKKAQEELNKDESSELEAMRLHLQVQSVDEIAKVGESIKESNKATLQAIQSFREAMVVLLGAMLSEDGNRDDKLNKVYEKLVKEIG